MYRSTNLTDGLRSGVGAGVRRSLEPDPTKLRVGGLDSLIYFSTAVEVPTVAQLEHMLLRARERNASEGVTGVLIYAEGSFIQYLEGPGAGLDRVYRRIQADSLHHDIFEVYREPIGSREFAEWQMAFAPTRVSGLAKHFPVNDHLAQRLRASKDTLSGGRHLLDACWGNGSGVRQGYWTAS